MQDKNLGGAFGLTAPWCSRMAISLDPAKKARSVNISIIGFVGHDFISALSGRIVFMRNGIR